MIKRISYFLLIGVIFMQSLPAFAGESADYVENMILNDYYPVLTVQTCEEIQQISIGTGDDNEKIMRMCSLLDQYSEYYSQGLPATSAQEPPHIEYAEKTLLYLKINKFAFGVDDQVKNLLEQNQNKTLFLDLTECSGGVLTVMENIGKKLVPSGTIYTARFRNEEQTVISELEDGKRSIFVLVSKETASCAEILAAALRESGVAILIGESTYGKASIQKVCILPNGGALKITVGHWLTRNGTDINGSGIVPDVLLNKNSLLWLKKIVLEG